MNKFELVRSVLKAHVTPSVSSRPRLLDVGCRGCELKPHVDDLVDYEGADLFQNPQNTVNHVLDVSKGLPFEDGRFDYVVALDLVEHLDDFEGGLRELLRVTRGKLLVMLPNTAHALFRQRFLFSGTLTGKYDMHYRMGPDRHRWVTTQVQCDALMIDFAKDMGVAIDTQWYNDSRQKDFFAAMCRMVGLSPNVWVWASLYVLDKTVPFGAAKKNG